jgi:YVTN family beta-propeller protein
MRAREDKGIKKVRGRKSGRAGEGETGREGERKTGRQSDKETCLPLSHSPTLPLLLLIYLLVPSLLTTAEAQNTSQSVQRFETGGVALEISLQPPSTNGNAIFTLRISDARSGEPLSNLHPKAWIVPRKKEKASEEGCRETIRAKLSGRLGANNDIDLNSYRLLTLNQDKSITIINPLLRFGRTKLESIIELPGVGADWALAPNRRTLFVTMPELAEVAVVDLVERKVLTTVPTGGKPRRIKLTPDGRQVWITVDELPRAVAIDVLTYRGVAVVPIGKGLHNIAMSADGRYAAITNSASDTVSVIDLKTMKRLSDMPAGQTPVAIAYSPAAKLFYTADLNGGTVSAIDPEAQKTVAVIPAKRGVVGIGFSPDGRFAVLVNQIESTASVLDSAINTITAEATVGTEPDQVAFTERYAYVRSLASDKFTLFDLSEIRKGNLSGVVIPAGRLAPNAAPDHLGVAAMIAPTPEGNSAMIANPADRMIYYYTEGLMAPMGTFDNYKRTPLALMILDNSLAETIAGVYSVQVKVPPSGDFDVPILIDQPRIAHCFPITLESRKPAPPSHALAIEYLFDNQVYKAGDPVKLRFKILDAATRAPLGGLRDVRALVMQPPDGWQQRQWAVEVEHGVYEVTQIFPRPGGYQVLVSVESRGADLTKLPRIKVEVKG